MHEPLVLIPGALSLAELRAVQRGRAPIRLDPACRAAVEAGASTIADIVARGQTVYGVNTGFGLLARQSIPADKLRELQVNLVVSHSTGTGPLLGDDIVRLIMALKAAALARGHSGSGGR